jgi:hypothetical protein
MTSPEHARLPVGAKSTATGGPGIFFDNDVGDGIEIWVDPSLPGRRALLNMLEVGPTISAVLTLLKRRRGHLQEPLVGPDPTCHPLARQH